MVRGAPDYVEQFQQVIIVENVPVPQVSTSDFVVATFGSVTTSSTEYQTVKSITVTADRVGVLRAVELACDNYDVAQWKLTIGGVTIFSDKYFPSSFTKEFPELQLAAGAVITLSVKSDGSTSLTAYGDFAYKEVG